jgi:integrase
MLKRLHQILFPIDLVDWRRSKDVVARLSYKSPQNKSCPKRLRAKECARTCRKHDWEEANKSVWEQARGLREPVRTEATWDEKETEEFYQRILGEAGKIAKRSVSTGFEESRRKTWNEFKGFLRKVGRGLTVENAGGLDVVAFVHGEWIPQHQKNFRTTLGETGEKVASASAIKGVIGHLAKSYTMLGRQDGENPAKAECVTSYRDGYRNELHDRGVREKRAKIMKESKVNDLIEYLNGEVGKATGIGKLVLLMDRAAVLYLWESWARGKECGELEARQIDREEAVALPGWSKTVHAEPSGRIELTRAGGGTTFLEGSAELLAEMEQQKRSLGKGYLFRPLNRSRTGFQDEPLKSSALKKRVQQHLAKANLFEGETLHSFRRLAVQHAAEIEGFDVERLMKKGRWASYAALRLYIKEIEYKFSRRTSV